MKKSWFAYIRRRFRSLKIKLGLWLLRGAGYNQFPKPEVRDHKPEIVGYSKQMPQKEFAEYQDVIVRQMAHGISQRIIDDKLFTLDVEDSLPMFNHPDEDWVDVKLEIAVLNLNKYRK